MEQEKPLDQDEQSRRRTDAVAEYEIAVGFRLRDVPPAVQQALRDEGVEPPRRIRLSRVNPYRRAAINDLVQKRFHKDIRDPDVLSNAQVLKIMTERGEWSADKQAEMEQLQERTTRDMGQLWTEGLTPETTSFLDDIVRGVKRFHELCDLKAVVGEAEAVRMKAVRERFDRWVSWTPRSTGYPEGYDAALEMAALYDDAPGVEAIDVVNDVEESKEKQERLIKLTEDRVKLAELQLKHARIFAETAESRREQTEELAQLYWTCERAGEDGKASGRLAADFEAVWKWPEEAIRWLLYEAFFFHHNVPDVARDYLGAFGFFAGGRTNNSSGKSAESPAPESSRTDGALSDTMPSASSESPPATS